MAAAAGKALKQSLGTAALVAGEAAEDDEDGALTCAVLRVSEVNPNLTNPNDDVSTVSLKSCRSPVHWLHNMV